jgi:hypothetical protein
MLVLADRLEEILKAIEKINPKSAGGGGTRDMSKTL